MVATLILMFFSSQAFCQVLEIHHINVGQGDSTLIVGPNGTTILVDAGNSGYFSLDGGKIVFEYLESLGISILDYAIVTHRDGDHVGGICFQHICHFQAQSFDGRKGSRRCYKKLGRSFGNR